MPEDQEERRLKIHILRISEFHRGPELVVNDLLFFSF